MLVVGLFWGASFMRLYKDRNQTGFIETENGIIYKDKDLSQKFGMQKIDGKLYYFDQKTGCLTSGFQKVKDKIYYFQEDGKILSGLKTIKKDTYFFNDDASLLTDAFHSVKKDKQNQISYFDADGKMHTKGNLTIDGIQYSFNSHGGLQYDINYLKSQVERIISEYGGNTSVYFKDLTSNESFLINDTSYYPCCMIKMPALVAVYQAIEQGKFTYDDYQFYIDNMIIVSDNTSYNRLMKTLGNGDGLQGLQKVNQICQTYGMQYTQLHHGLLPGEDHFTDNQSNVSRTKDIGILLEALYNKQVLSKQSSEDMLTLLKKCNDTDGIAQGFPSSIEYAHKTGEISNIFNDGGIVYLPNRNYIVVVFAEDVGYKYNLMKDVSTFLFDYQSTFAKQNK